MGDKKITIVIPLTPIGKGRARSGKNGSHYTPEKTREWERAATFYIQRALRNEQRPLFSQRTPISILIEAFFPCGFPERLGQHHVIKPDGDNIAKAVLDALQKAEIIYDDAQAWEITVRKRYERELRNTFNENGSVLVTIWETRR